MGKSEQVFVRYHSRMPVLVGKAAGGTTEHSIEYDQTRNAFISVQNDPVTHTRKRELICTDPVPVTELSEILQINLDGRFPGGNHYDNLRVAEASDFIKPDGRHR